MGSPKSVFFIRLECAECKEHLATFWGKEVDSESAAQFICEDCAEEQERNEDNFEEYDIELPENEIANFFPKPWKNLEQKIQGPLY